MAGIAAFAMVVLMGGAKAEEFTLGSPDAPVTLIEYASMSCPHCARFHKAVLPWLKETYIEPGTVKIVYRDFPLNRSALYGAVAVHCVGRDKAIGMIDFLFLNQAEWAFVDDARETLAGIVGQAGLGEDAFRACLADDALANGIVKARADAQRDYEIKSTPSFLIGDEVHAGLQSPEMLTELIEAARQ
ncbi:MAG: DsbA family protein [Alphaproteobacteria bacterium]|nr:DsbA family protein [Alphaproteobacteria bacterium]